jgi:hypothetical protein
VVLPAVGFHEDLVVLEDEVRFEGLDVVVGLRRLREAGVTAQGEEPLLELGSREGGAGVVVLEGAQQLVGSSVARLGSCQGIEGEDVAEPLELSASRRRSMPRRSSVAARSRMVRPGGGDGDAVLRRGLAGEVAGAVDADALPARPPAGAGQRDVDGRGPARTELPERGGRGVAEDGVRAAREHGGHPPPTSDEHRVAHRVYTAVERMERAASRASGDTCVRDAECAQLGTRDDAVLAPREVRNGGGERS